MLGAGDRILAKPDQSLNVVCDLHASLEPLSPHAKVCEFLMNSFLKFPVVRRYDPKNFHIVGQRVSKSVKPDSMGFVTADSNRGVFSVDRDEIDKRSARVSNPVRIDL